MIAVALCEMDARSTAPIAKFPEQFSSICSYYLMMSTTPPFEVTRMKKTSCPIDSDSAATFTPRAQKPYRNLYQIASCRKMSQYAGTCLFLGKSQKTLRNTGEGSPIPTLASSSCGLARNNFGSAGVRIFTGIFT